MKRSMPMSSAAGVPARRARNDGGEPQSPAELSCVAAGAIHQSDVRFRGNGSQCTANAMIAILHARHILSIHHFDFDFVLSTGDDLYIQLEPLIPAHISNRYLCPDELPNELQLGSINVKVERNYITNDLYPTGYNDQDIYVLRLQNTLETLVFDESWDDDNDGCLFTGCDYTVSFWRSKVIEENGTINTKYYIFNSHAVDENNKTCSDGVARVFELQSTKALANALLTFKIVYGAQYEINKIHLLRSGFSRLTTPISDSDRSEISKNQDPSGMLNVLDSQRTQCSKSSVSRDSTGLMLSVNEITCNVVVATQTSQVSQNSYNSISILDCTAATELTYADAVKKSITATHKNGPAQSFKSIIANQPVVVIEKVDDLKLKYLKPVVVLDRLESVQNNLKAPAKRGRPIKIKKGPKKIKDNSHLDAVLKYNAKTPNVHRVAVKAYIKNKPEVHRDSVKKYTQNKPEINRESVKKYTQNKPEINRESVKKYTQNKPEVHRDSAKKYTRNKPEVNRGSVQKYSQKHPDVNLKAVQKYQESHPDIIKQTSAQYNKNSRNIDVPLRRSRNLISEKRGDELNSVKAFALKNPSLKSPNIYVCEHCHAPLFEEERSARNFCCGLGRFNVLDLGDISKESFYAQQNFYDRSRAYNNLFAFSALGVSHGFHHPQGLAFIKIQGRTYHRVFDLAYDKSINNIGLYISDSSEREHLARNQSLDLDIVRSITSFLHNVNPFIECFKRLSLEASDEAYIMFEKTSRATHGNILGDQPVGREVAAIISTDREQYVPRCIAIWKVGERKPHTVDIMHTLYESFQYPLLYPEGTPGWYPGRLDNNGNKLTQVKYVRCLLLSEDRFSHCSRLSEEWLVDMYCRISEERLRYLLYMQTNRSDIRMATVHELLLNDETIRGEGIVPGRIYLPNSFTGGPRYMKMKYLDCIALVNRLGPPSYFVTFTCNPKWPEITQSTPEGQRPNPLLCARVFHLRLLALIRDIRSGAWFGPTQYITYVIEFQKRGLPHAHICFRVERGPMQASEVDLVCRADIPDSLEAEGRLRKAVLDHMIHGPCGQQRSDLPCYDKEKKICSKRFPKRETEVTICDDRGFMHLRRNSKNEGVIRFRNREITVNDLWVVPYNASLLLKYDAHINVEVSSHRNVVKYLFKYMTKGPDEARVAVVDETEIHNEIEQYVTKRYIGSSDAAWRVLEYDVTSREPNVKQLTVHLEHKQTVYFKPGHETEVNRESSDLLTYFNRPQGEQFESLKYTDFYEQYIVHSKKPTTKAVVFETTNGKFVTERQRGQMVARLFWVAPNRGEQFYLRILLNVFPCRGYADLLHLGGVDNISFQESAKKQGLVDNCIEYEMCMQEASTFFTGHRLRRFFVLLAVNGAPVATLWDLFKNQLAEDFLHRLPNDSEKAYNMALLHISRLLQKHSLTLELVGLPQVQDNSTELGRELVGYDVEHQISVVDEWLPRLSSGQRAVFEYVKNLCTDENFLKNNSNAIFIDGPAGTGKTQLINTITAHVRGNLKSVAICTASSAIAAQNLENASTAHSMFKFPLDLPDDNAYWGITNKTQRAQLLYHSQIIIYDEAPMAHKYLIHMLDRSLRDLMQVPDKMFGGKIVILAGDFRQIPPVIVDAKSDSDIVNCSLKTSPLWPNLKKFTLIESQRCREDPEYADFLLKLGSNELPTFPLTVGGSIQKMVAIDMIEHVTDLNDLIDFVFSEAIVDEPDVCALRAILCTRNDAARQINSIVLNRVPGDLLHFYSTDKIENDDADELYLGPDVLNKIQPPGIPDFDLQIKIGCVCMITRNLSFVDGLVNGTKVIVTSATPRLITVRKRGCLDNVPYLIPRILFKTPIERNSPYEMSRRQFPLQVCYAMTIHKSQGQTLTKVGLNLNSPCFSHGQLYTAMSRSQNRNSIKILLDENFVKDGKPYANNKIISDLIT